MIKGVSMPAVDFGTFSKKRNSTQQPTNELSDSRTVKLKELTSYDAPTFILTGDEFAYNYGKWGNRYYFIGDVRSIHNNLCEVDCVLDPLATYKADILASIQFVLYSSLKSSNWLKDTRIPILASESCSRSSASLGIFDTSPVTGRLILSALGKNGVATYNCAIADVHLLLTNLENWADGDINDIISNIQSSNDPAVMIGELAKALTVTGFYGNAYSQAPSCIRSCVWSALTDAAIGGSSTNIFLGKYDTGYQGKVFSTTAKTASTSVSIPWTYSDWRRVTCEDVYVYLPYSGVISIPSESVSSVSSLSITCSYSPTDGNLAYQISAGNEIVGTYTGNCNAPYAIGLNQSASLGEIAQTVFKGADKMLSVGLNTRLTPQSQTASVIGVGMKGIEAAYNTLDVMHTTNPTCIGSIGGCTGAGLSTDIICFVVHHPSLYNPDDHAATMGYPTMKQMSLSTLTGYCQCANAHVECAAQANELDAIDYYLNSGFFIE